MHYLLFYDVAPDYLRWALGISMRSGRWWEGQGAEVWGCRRGVERRSCPAEGGIGGKGARRNPQDTTARQAGALIGEICA